MPDTGIRVSLKEQHYKREKGSSLYHSGKGSLRFQGKSNTRVISIDITRHQKNLIEGLEESLN